MQAELSKVDPELAKQIIESDSPELIGLLNELKESLDTAQSKLEPIL